VRHITDGELHAHLDGALDLLPDGRGEEIREHLSHCPACRERLQDEEEVRERSEEIMAGFDLGSLGLPTFEELRERAAAPEADGAGSRAAAPEAGRVRGEGMTREGRRSRYRGPLKGMPWAWAATIVLALGVGWMGGEVWRTLPQEGRPAGVGKDTEAGGVAELGGALEARVGGDPRDSGVTGRAGPGELLSREPGAESIQVGSMDAQTAGIRSSDAGVLDVRADVPPPPAARSDEPPAKISRPLGEEGTLEALVRSRSLEASLSPQRLRVTGDAPVPDAFFRASTGVGNEEGFVESSLAVPGLEVLSVEWEEWLPGERALHIRQLLSMGDTLELRYLGMLMGMEPFEEARAARRAQALEAGVDRPLSPAVLGASLPPGWTQVEMRWGRGWLVARAPLPAASIKALLRTLR